MQLKAFVILASAMAVLAIANPVAEAEAVAVPAAQPIADAVPVAEAVPKAEATDPDTLFAVRIVPVAETNLGFEEGLTHP